MMIAKDIERIIAQNVEIQSIHSGGGIIWISKKKLEEISDFIKNNLGIEFGNGTWFYGDGFAGQVGRSIKTMPQSLLDGKLFVNWKSSDNNIMKDDGTKVGAGNMSFIATIRVKDSIYKFTKEFRIGVI